MLAREKKKEEKKNLPNYLQQSGQITKSGSKIRLPDMAYYPQCFIAVIFKI